jgi:hypothetical protein
MSRMLSYAADAPSWTDKLEAWSTFGGTVFTATAVIVAFLVWRHDQRVRREDKADADAAQARLVVNRITRILGDSEEGWKGVEVLVLNNSSGSITNVRVTLAFPHSVTFAGDEEGRDLASGERHQDQLAFDSPVPWRFTGKTKTPPGPINQLDISTRFDDAAGRRWIRTNDREPQRRTILVRFSVWPMLAEYLYLTPGSRWFNAKGRRLRNRLFDGLAVRLRNRHARALERETD